MKIKLDFVTNSSSAAFLVRNKSDTMKTMLDLLQEAAAGQWEIAYTGIGPHNWQEGFDSEQKFREEVAKIESFPPKSEVTVVIAWGEGGPIYCPNGLLCGRTRNFEIRDLGM